jgi:hypothetical protein
MSDVKYYVIDVDGGDVDKAVSSIVKHQSVDEDMITILSGGIDQVFAVPRLSEHSGIGMVLLSSTYLTRQIYANEFVTDYSIMMRDAFDRIFIVDCSKPFYKQKIGLNTNLNNFVNFDVGDTSLWRIATKLNSVLPDAHKSPEPAPEPEPVVEPEPSDFKVETWVPQDELPDSGE